MFRVPAPELQIDFSRILSEIRGEYLQDALAETVRSLYVPDIDNDLAVFVPKSSLGVLASQGLRGELVFSVPVVLVENPRLLGYYRLLYGYSKKQFYTSDTGISRFQSMERTGALTPNNARDLPALCRELAGAGSLLLNGIGANRVTAALLDDLTLLTLGPQLRGGANVKKGIAAIFDVFDAICEIVESAVQQKASNRIELKNAAGRRVLIEFSTDPDIIIREEMQQGQFRELIAIEVKGGSDFSNIHNRIGEAEKSHQKAKIAGYAECWTVVNVDRTDLNMAKLESPSTNRFYRISDLLKADGDDYIDFRSRIISLTGIPS